MSGKKNNKPYKDTSFHLFGSFYTVKFIDSVAKLEEDEGKTSKKFIYGVNIPEKQTIYISTKDRDGNLLSDNIIKTTLLHEMVHAIFDTGCYHDSNLDEPLVEWTARCILTLLDQKFFTANFNLCK